MYDTCTILKSKGNSCLSQVLTLCIFILLDRSVIEFTRILDATRPVTFVTSASAATDKAVL